MWTMEGSDQHLPVLLLVCVMIVLSGSEFLKEPVHQRIAQGQKARFDCQHSTSVVGWRINGTDFIPNSVDGVISDIINDNHNIVYRLEIDGHPRYNLTNVTCWAVSLNLTLEFASYALLTIQGPLGSVANLFRVSSNISWTPPFSLDLTGVEPDVIYCIEVYNTTCGNDVFLFRNCNVTKPYYFNHTLPKEDTLKITVVPRSNVDVAHNGQPLTRREKFTSLSRPVLLDITGSTTRIQVTEIDVGDNTVSSGSYTLLLNPVDDVTNISRSISAQILERKDNTLVLLMKRLPWKRLWKCTITAQTCPVQASLSTEELSTHDVQNISLTSYNPGKVRVTGNWIRGSTARGVLVIVYNYTNVHYHFLEHKHEPYLDANLTVCLGGEYNVSIFVMQANGELYNRTVLQPISVSITVAPSGPDECHHKPSLKSTVSYTSSGIHVRCTLPDDNVAATCLAVVHKKLLHLDSDGLRTIIASRTFKRSRNSNIVSGFIKDLNVKDYHVGVVEVTLKQTVEPNGVNFIAIIIIIAVLIVFAVLLLVLSVRCIVYKCKQRDTLHFIPKKVENGNLQGRSSNRYVIMSSNTPTKEQATNERKEVPLLGVSVHSPMPETTTNTDGVQHEPPPAPFKPEGVYTPSDEGQNPPLAHQLNNYDHSTNQSVDVNSGQLAEDESPADNGLFKSKTPTSIQASDKCIGRPVFAGVIGCEDVVVCESQISVRTTVVTKNHISESDVNHPVGDGKSSNIEDKNDSEAGNESEIEIMSPSQISGNTQAQYVEVNTKFKGENKRRNVEPPCLQTQRYAKNGETVTEPSLGDKSMDSQNELLSDGEDVSPFHSLSEYPNTLM